TGNKDPFALRRAALGLARTVIESGLDLDLPALAARAAGHVADGMTTVEAARLAAAESAPAKDAGAAGGKRPTPPPAPEVLAGELYDFILERLRGYYADRGVPPQQFAAVAELRPASLYDFD